MTNVQPVYATGVAVGVPGMIANEEKCNKISRTVESVAGVAFGQPCFRGANDHGCVVGGTFAGTSVSSVDGTNVGTATISATPAVAAPAMAGRYIIELMATGATAAFNLIDPNGLIVGDGNIGTAATLGGIGPFTITTGGTPTVGDRFYIDVTYTANVKFLGIAVLNAGVAVNSAAPDGYRQYDTAAIMTSGAVWVVAGGSVVPGGAVYWDPATLRYSSDTTKIRMGSALRFDTTASNGQLALIATSRQA